MIIFGQNGVGKSTLLYSVKQSISENVVRSDDIILFLHQANQTRWVMEMNHPTK